MPRAKKSKRKRAKRVRKDRTEYFEEYYARRKVGFSQERKDLYRTDPEYREKVLDASRDYRKRKSAEREKLRAAGKLPPPKPPGPRDPIDVMIEGDKCKAYTITTAAERLKRSTGTLNMWMNVGLLPVTPIRSERGDRLFTDAMLLVVGLAITKRVRISRKDKTFYSDIVDGWARIGVFVG